MNHVETYSLANSMVVTSLGISVSQKNSTHTESSTYVFNALATMLSIFYVIVMLGLFIAFYVYEEGDKLKQKMKSSKVM